MKDTIKLFRETNWRHPVSIPIEILWETTGIVYESEIDSHMDKDLKELSNLCNLPLLSYIQN